MLWAPHVSAQTLGSVSVAGNCPTTEQVGAALAARTLPETARSYRLVVHSERGHTEFLLSDREGHVELDRFVASDDCAAMADVVALVTEAFFVELVARGQPPDDTSSIVSAKPAPPPGSAPEQREDRESLPAPATPAEERPPPRRAPAPTPTSATGAASPDSSIATSHAGPTLRHFVVALGTGADAYVDPSAVAPFGQLGAALYLGVPRLSFELHAVAEAAEPLRSAPNRVLRSETRVALRVERDFGTAVDFSPWLGFGAAVSRSRALDLDGPVRHLTAPFVEGGVSVRAARTASFGVDAELGCHVLFIRERYVVAPDGNIGDGPRFGCQLGPNVSWSSREF